MFTHKIGVTYSSDAGTITTTTNTYQDNTEENYDAAVATATTNLSVPIALTIASLKSLVIYSDQAISIKTNSSGSPQETITLAAKQQITWAYDGHDPISSLFSGNITGFFITNTSGFTANIKFRFLSHV